MNNSERKTKVIKTLALVPATFIVAFLVSSFLIRLLGSLWLVPVFVAPAFVFFKHSPFNKKATKALIIIGSIPFAAMTLLLIGRDIHYFKVHERIHNADHVEILAECRNIIKAKQDGSNIYSTISLTNTNYIGQAILDLEPAVIWIGDDTVTFNMGTAPRTAVRAFAVGAPQSGTTILTNGLWICTGDDIK